MAIQKHHHHHQTLTPHPHHHNAQHPKPHNQLHHLHHMLTLPQHSDLTPHSNQHCDNHHTTILAVIRLPMQQPHHPQYQNPPLLCTGHSMTTHLTQTWANWQNMQNSPTAVMGTYGMPPSQPKSIGWPRGMAIIPGTNTMCFILVHQLPHGIKATYLCAVCAYQPEKDMLHCIRWTVGGDCMAYTGNVSTKTANLSTIKILFNSIISMPKAKSCWVT